MRDVLMGEEHRQTPQRTRREFIEEPWSRRTGAPQASATRRDRDPMLTRRTTTSGEERAQDGTALWPLRA
jgi:hypothetical protein